MEQLILDYGAQLFFGCVSTVLAFCYGRLSQRLHKQECLNNVLLGMIHNELFRLAEEYTSKGCISADELENMTVLYTSYHEAGGNGSGSVLYEKCKNLPLKGGNAN